MTFLQGYPQERKIFSSNIGSFPSEPKSSISGFSCFKIYGKKMYKIDQRPLTARGGGVKALAEASAKNAIFYVVP